jgi:gliding motility-associated-like protein
MFGDGGSAVTKNPSHTFENITSSERTFTTKLKAYSVYNCVDSSTISIKVYPFIKAGFSFDKPVGCSPHPITITNSSSAGSNGFQWFFGNGQQSNITAPVFSHTYRNLGTTPQTFYPKLIASYNGKCHDTISLSLQVFPEVTAAFTEDTLRGCHPLEITLRNQSRNANRFNWSFGDMGTSIVTSPKHTYTNFSNVDSVYNLKLTATSIFNCQSTINKTVTIYAKPKALLDVDNSVNCPPFQLPIRNLSEAGDYYYWSFGDGDSIVSTDQTTLNHTYDNLTATTVTYNLKLFVQSVHNCTDQLEQSINVYPRVVAAFTPDTAGCSPLLVPLSNTTLRAVTYKWDFGDNITSALKNPTHRFFNSSTEDTTFNVRMIGFSQFGCSDTMFRQVTVYPQPTVDFSALPSHLFYPDARVNIDNQTNPGNWNYHWNFDDGQTSAVMEPGVHEYMRWGNFNIRLSAWSDQCSDSASHRIRVFAPNTIADFDPSDNGCVPLTVMFTNHSTWATSYKWEFDDGSVSTEMHPNHIYQKPGKYQVKLTTYGDGPEDVTYREVVVYPKPEVSFDVSPREVMLPDALVQCYNTSKLGNKYLWEFGDDETSESFEPKHTYKELGVYDITLNVWTEHQCFDSVVMQRAVEVKGTGVLIFPNAFKPSTDGPGDGRYTLPDIKNTVFHPHHDGIAEYKLEVYDRLGELIFESKDVNKGWDGYFKGKLCKSDVYIWKAKGKFYNGSTFNKAGDVTLLR